MIRSVFAGRPARRYVLILVVATLLMGCASTTPEVRTETITVRVPVPTDPPAPPRPSRPALPIAGIDSTSSPQAVTQAYVASVILLQGYARQLETLLRSYRDSTRARRVEARR